MHQDWPSAHSKRKEKATKSHRNETCQTCITICHLVLSAVEKTRGASKSSISDPQICTATGTKGLRVETQICTNTDHSFYRKLRSAPPPTTASILAVETPICNAFFLLCLLFLCSGLQWLLHEVKGTSTYKLPKKYTSCIPRTKTHGTS